jgi:hypothetical protein
MPANGEERKNQAVIRTAFRFFQISLLTRPGKRAEFYVLKLTKQK